MSFETGVAPDGVRGLARARWVAPPGTSFTAARFTWSGSLQPGNWQGLGVDVGGGFRPLARRLHAARRRPPVDLPIGGPAWAFEAFAAVPARRAGRSAAPARRPRRCG